MLHGILLLGLSFTSQANPQPEDLPAGQPPLFISKECELGQLFATGHLGMATPEAIEHAVHITFAFIVTDPKKAPDADILLAMIRLESDDIPRSRRLTAQTRVQLKLGRAVFPLGNPDYKRFSAQHEALDFAAFKPAELLVFLKRPGKLELQIDDQSYMPPRIGVQQLNAIRDELLARGVLTMIKAQKPKYPPVKMSSGSWRHVSGKDKPVTIRFLPGGYVNRTDSGISWGYNEHEGRILLIGWPDPRVPGGERNERCVVAEDGKSYAGEDQFHNKVYGTAQ